MLPSDLKKYLADTERDIIEAALEMHGGNRTAAGQALGLSLRQIRYRIHALGIDRANFEGRETSPRKRPGWSLDGSLTIKSDAIRRYFEAKAHGTEIAAEEEPLPDYRASAP